MSYTHSGKTSFIHKESEDLLVIQALEFAFNFEVWAYSIFPPTGIWRRLNMGDIKFAAFVYDSNGNTTKVPITLPVTNSWLTISVPLPPPLFGDQLTQSAVGQTLKSLKRMQSNCNTLKLVM